MKGHSPYYKYIVITEEKGIKWVNNQKAIGSLSYDRVYSIVRNNPDLSRTEYANLMVRYAYEREKKWA